MNAARLCAGTPSFTNLYTIASTSASNEASMTLPDTPTVDKISPAPSPNSIKTRVTASAPPWKTRTVAAQF